MNKRFEAVGYRKFQTEPLLAEGLLAVARPGGELLDAVSSALFRLAGEFNQVADRQAVKRNTLAAEQDTLADPLKATIEDGAPVPPPVGGHGKARGASFAGSVNAAIDQAAARHGVDAATLRTIAQIESGGNPRAKNPRSSAGGLFQFVDGTARDYGLADRYDAAQASDAAARLMKANASYLRKNLGREPSPGELYLAHQQGMEGARKLLKNPNARAVDVVGAQAVRLNGGTAGMTAGQFANLWIRKAENGYVMPSNPDQLVGAEGAAPDPVAGPASVRLSGGRWRPSGQDTIAGRAYDEAGARVYLQQVQTEMVSTTAQLYDRYRDDPAGLTQALGDLKGQLLKDHVFPEIQADFEMAYGDLANGHVARARDNLAARQEAQAKADFAGRTNELETEQARLLADSNPADPAIADQLALRQAAIDAHYDDAARRGYMTPAAAANSKASNRREAAKAFYVKQAEALDADGVTALHEKMRADFAAGGLDGVDADGWTAIDAKLTALAKSKATAAENSIKDLVKAGDDIAKRAAQGYDVDPTVMSQFATAASMVPGGETILAETQQRIASGTAIRDLPLDDARAYVEKMRADMGSNPSERQIDTLDFAEKAVDKKATALATDPLSYAANQGLVEVSPIDTTSQDTLDASLASRRAQAEEASRRLGVPVPLYTPAEVKIAKGQLATTDAKTYGDLMTQFAFLAGETGLDDVVDTFGDKAGTMLQDWQGRLRYATGDEVKAFLKERADPRWRERMQPLEREGAKEARKKSFEDIVDGVDGERGWLATLGDPFNMVGQFWDAVGPVDTETKRMLMEDYTTLASERFAATQDAGTAHSQAIERLQRSWGITSVYGGIGGRLMPYPPETAYPAIGGDQAWLGQQLGEFAGKRGLDMKNLSLVADGRTRKEREAAQPPGYLVSVTDPDTGLDEMLTGEDGKPVRLYFDAVAAQRKALARAQEERDTHPVLDREQNLDAYLAGPPVPWRPASTMEMRSHQRRIEEMAAPPPDNGREKRFAEKRRMRRILNGGWDR